MYNLPEGADENAFLDWRRNHHQGTNAALRSGEFEYSICEILTSSDIGEGSKS
jgi:hypothetical protein